VTSDREAKRAKGSATAGQNADQAAVAVSRQEAAIRRAFTRRGGLLSDGGARTTAPAHAAVLSRHAARVARHNPPS
jgi:hypothetical protein